MKSQRPKILAESWRTSNMYNCMRDAIRARHVPVTFVNGCFDLLHSGHTALFNFAINESVRKMCFREDGVLVVGLNSDASVRRLKGPGRPIVHFAERALMLLSLETVDAVIGFDEDDASELIADLKPRFYVKGGDYKGKEIPEQKAMPPGSEILYCDRDTTSKFDCSSTKVVGWVIEAEKARVASLPGFPNPHSRPSNPVAGTGDPQSGKPPLIGSGCCGCEDCR